MKIRRQNWLNNLRFPVPFFCFLEPRCSVSGPFWSPKQNPKQKNRRLHLFQTTFLDTVNCNTKWTFLAQDLNEKNSKTTPKWTQKRSKQHKKNEVPKVTKNGTRRTRIFDQSRSPKSTLETTKRIAQKLNPKNMKPRTPQDGSQIMGLGPVVASTHAHSAQIHKNNFTKPPRTLKNSLSAIYHSGADNERSEGVNMNESH